MSREIKFRGWHKEWKAMLSWNCISKMCGGASVTIALNPNCFQKIKKNPFNSRALELMQFTGLKDKNRREIYEGDVLRLHKPWYTGGIVHIEYSEPMASFVIKMPGAVHLDWEMTKYYEVIGNIYENPELLSKKNA